MNFDDFPALTPDVVCDDGSAVGQIVEVHMPADTAEAFFARVSYPGVGDALVPLLEAEVRGGAVQVPFTTSLIRTAPDFPADTVLSLDEMNRVLSHYGYADAHLGSNRTSEDEPTS